MPITTAASHCRRLGSRLDGLRKQKRVGYQASYRDKSERGQAGEGCLVPAGPAPKNA